jgi:transcriptional regulator of heat shock response
MKPALTDYMVGEKVLYQAILEAFVKFTGERMALYGKEALFNQPEFNTNAEKLRKVLSLLDNPDELRKAVKDSKATPTGVKVHIGSEEGPRSQPRRAKRRNKERSAQRDAERRG